jgi:L-alanine-DL-glutamate epimerase-like enolase superfamily enzyme
MEPYELFFVEDLLPPEQLDWYREVRNEELAAKYPIAEIRNRGAYRTDRTIDGAVVKP